MTRRGRLAQPGLISFSLRRKGHQRLPERFGLLCRRFHPAFVVLGFVVLQPLLDVGAAVCEQVRDEARELVRRCREGFGGAKACRHTPEKGAEGTLRVVHTARRKP